MLFHSHFLLKQLFPDSLSLSKLMLEKKQIGLNKDLVLIIFTFQVIVGLQCPLLSSLNYLKLSNLNSPY